MLRRAKSPGAAEPGGGPGSKSPDDDAELDSSWTQTSHRSTNAAAWYLIAAAAFVLALYVAFDAGRSYNHNTPPLFGEGADGGSLGDGAHHHAVDGHQLANAHLKMPGRRPMPTPTPS